MVVPSNAPALGEKVLVQKPNEATWVPGCIKEKCSEPRSYLVEMPNGNVLRRNRKFFKELSPNASKKFKFCNESYSSDDCIENDKQPNLSIAGDNESNNIVQCMTPERPSVSLNDRADLMYVRSFKKRLQEELIKRCKENLNIKVLSIKVY